MERDWWQRLVGLRVVSRLAAEWTRLTRIPLFLRDPAQQAWYPLSPSPAAAPSCKCEAAPGLVAQGGGRPVLLRCRAAASSHYVLHLRLGEQSGHLMTGPFLRDGLASGAQGPVLAREVEPLYTHFLRVIGEEMQRYLEEQHRPAAGSTTQTLLGDSPQIRALRKEIEEVARSRYTTLITGESGTGKDLVAWLLHKGSARARGPFVVVSCAALPESLFESEVFGHGRGAFTGAHADKQGLLETARGGTLFLDEIAELSLAMQAKLLRCLESGSFYRLGEVQPIQADVRVIAATNRDLEQMVAQGGFRGDLYFRLRVMTLHLPPLRERNADVALLARHFLAQIAERGSGTTHGLTAEAESLLAAYPWPGNVRQLWHELERAHIRSRGAAFAPEHFSEEIRRTAQPPPALGARAWTREEIERRLAGAGWNVTALARELRMSRRTLTHNIARLGVRRPGRAPAEGTRRTGRGPAGHPDPSRAG